MFLFAAGTDAEVFEEELRAVGLPTYRAAGRGYFAQQQVLDVLSYLRLLHNRYDDEALAAVLASPLVGVSNDALVLLRRAASRRPLFAGLERQLPQSLSARDEQLFRAFRQRYDRLVALSATAGLERLIDQIVSEHDYDLAVLAQHDGRRRYANLRKLGRLARSYEALRGRDVEGFVRFVFDRQASGAHEAEAFAEEEGGDAVRLLTIHAAKGLEFRVVVVADAGRDRPPSRGEEIICRPDGLFGFKVLNPATGKRRGAFDYEAVRSAEQAAEEAERLRLYYVAMTRAIDRLLVSGSIDPSRAQEARTPMAWVLDRLGSVRLDDVGDEPLVVEQGAARLLVRVNRHHAEIEEAASEPEPAVEEQLSLFSGEEEVAETAGRDAAAARARRAASRLRAAPALVQRAGDVRRVRREVLRAVRRRDARAAARDGARRRRCRVCGSRAAGGDRPRRAGRSRGPRRAPTRCDAGGAREDRGLPRVLLRLEARRPDLGARGRAEGAVVLVRARRRRAARLHRRARAWVRTRSSSTSRRMRSKELRPRR